MVQKIHARLISQGNVENFGKTIIISFHLKAQNNS